VKIIKFKKFKDNRGTLFYNFYKDFNFKVKRTYFLKNFNKSSRGNHARKFGKKLYICLSGVIKISLETKRIKKKINLNTGDSLKVEKYTWLSIKGNHKSICLVLDSLDYNEKHYIRDKKKFLKQINNENTTF
tara:strand:+ start:101 stop:496 length:396 start_codon:yes stop_codon:yes gene_type:complete